MKRERERDIGSHFEFAERRTLMYRRSKMLLLVMKRFTQTSCVIVRLYETKRAVSFIIK